MLASSRKATLEVVANGNVVVCNPSRVDAAFLLVDPWVGEALPGVSDDETPSGSFLRWGYA